MLTNVVLWDNEGGHEGGQLGSTDHSHVSAEVEEEL